MATDPVIPPPPDGSGVVPTTAPQPVSSIPPAPDGSAAIPAPPDQTLGTPQKRPGVVSRFAGNLLSQNPIKGIVDTAKALLHPSQTWEADKAARRLIGQEATSDIRTGGIVGGATGVAKRLESFAPIVGPALHALGNQFESGDLAGGYGTALGMALNIAGPEVIGSGISVPKGIRSGLESAADSQYRGALKPPRASGIAKTAKVDRAVATGLEEGIPVSKAGREQLRGLIDDLNQQARDVIATDPNRPISPARAVANTQDLETSGKFANQVDPISDLAAIRRTRENFLAADRPGLGPIRQPGPVEGLGNLTAEEAQAIKQGTYRNLGDRAYERSRTGAPESAAEAAEKSLARGLKDDLAQEFPELAKVNARESGALDLEPMILGRVSQVAKNQMIGIGAPILGAAVKGVTGSSGLAGAAGFIKALYTPAVQSRVAIMLHRASQGTIPLSVAKMRVLSYVNALGQAVDAGTGPLALNPASQ